MSAKSTASSSKLVELPAGSEPKSTIMPADEKKLLAVLSAISTNQDNTKPFSLNEQLLARLSEQEQRFKLQRKALKDTSGCNDFYSRRLLKMTSSTSLPVSPTLGEHPATVPAARPASVDQREASPQEDELTRLKAELAQAHNKISRLDQELTQKREVAPQKPIISGIDLIGRPSSAAFKRENEWDTIDITQLGGGDAMNDEAGDRSRGVWANSKSPWQGSGYVAPDATPINNLVLGGGGGGLYPPPMDANGPYRTMDNIHPERPAPERLAPEPDLYPRNHGSRRGNTNQGGHRYAAYPYAGNGYSQANYTGTNYPATSYANTNYANSSYANSNFGGYSAGPNQYDSSNVPKGGMDMAHYPAYNQSGRTGLSPHALEFHSHTGWKDEAIATEGQTFLPSTEPMNYRRLLDKNASCDWTYIVDKIVCHNDQQASIFLQQKLKVGTPDQKYEIVEGIIAQAYPLMINRFGNFLVQRCFEHGTPEQVVKIAEAIRGNTLNLSMDPFGCHVVQKAFDAVPEEYKAVMVQELLRRIPETVIHRYACHVWQKLFELRWSETPPQIMKYVNEALRGMWHEVALGETGSLVVQNIFENCLEEDKRPCIEEVLLNIDIVAHGQFGNWCIQHICEHGAPPDRSRAIDHVIRYASEYSTDQFASKVVEKCLKIGGHEFLSRYLDRVCKGRRDRPRIPLIDISSDQYGNYLVQYILTHAGLQHREMVAAHIRKHMVSLRGSKFGSRVGMLCTNPAVVTRPGPGVGPGMPRMGGGPRGFGNPYR
ncbi:hypothetical protein ACHAQA_007389 [Verticillium albo-atrum]